MLVSAHPRLIIVTHVKNMERSRCRQVINRLLQSGNATPGGFMLYPPGIPFTCYSGDCPYINKTVSIEAPVSIEAHFVVCSCLLPSSTPRGGLHI